MLVSPHAPPGASSQRADKARTPVVAAVRGPGESARGVFARTDAEGGGEPSLFPSGGPLALRHDVPVGPEPTVACAAAAVDRLLVGATPGVAEVRLGVSAGPLAGVEVRLVMAPQGLEIAFLSAEAGTRRMIAGVAVELQRRLEARGRRIARIGVVPYAHASSRGRP